MQRNIGIKQMGKQHMCIACMSLWWYQLYKVDNRELYENWSIVIVFHSNRFLSGSVSRRIPLITLAPIKCVNRRVLWASYQIRKIAGCACAGNAGNVFPRRRFQRKPLVSDPGMHHGTCVTHVPWCMSGSLTCGDGENVPGIPGACAPAILRIWQEAHRALMHNGADPLPIC